MKELLEIPTITDRRLLLELKDNEKLAANVNVVYIYYLVDETILYPKGKSKVLYIGEAMRKNEPTGNRFKQHITSKEKKGADTGSNLTLSQYFHAKNKIGLKIYKTEKPNRKNDERYLIYSHINLYGSPPIAQGSIPSDDNNKNKTTHIFKFIDNNKEHISNASEIINEINEK